MKTLAVSLGWLICFLAPGTLLSEDYLRSLQENAVKENAANWGHWGPNQGKYSSWTTHSNRLIPVYTFGMNLSEVAGENSVYRDEAKLKDVYGFLPEKTLNPEADYFDQTDVFRLQELAVKAGKKCIVLMIFDGMDWQTAQAAAIYKNGKVLYKEGRGSGLAFLDYDQAETDFGYCVTSPHNDGTNTNVNGQKITNPGGNLRGGYAVDIAGPYPWSSPADLEYTIGKSKTLKHAYPDSAATATSMTVGIKTYNNAINVDAVGRPVVPIARTLQADGFAVGVVTSVPISHATPAAAYANNVHRSDYQDITRDLLGLSSVANPAGLSGLDVLIGAGWGETKKSDGAQGTNFVPGNVYLTAEDQSAIDLGKGGKYVTAIRTPGETGTSVLSRAAKQAKSDGKRLFGYFGTKGGHLPYATADGKFNPTVDENGKSEKYSEADIAENPTLAEMTTTALEVLSARSENIWLMVEAGDVDWANHSNNLDNSIGAVYSGEAAFTAITNWVENNVGWEHAAVIVTSDHGHYLVLDKPEALIPKK
jgi:alkaline phosphatase